MFSYTMYKQRKNIAFKLTPSFWKNFAMASVKSFMIFI